MTTEHAHFLAFADRWWMLLIRGIAAILFGVLTFAFPSMSLLALVLLYGSYAIVDGVFNIILSFRRARAGTRWEWLLFEGLVSVVAGGLTLFWPGLTALALLVLIAVRALMAGVAQIVMAARLRRHIRHEWLLGMSGVISIGFGVLLLLYPGAGALTLLWFIGAYAIVVGALLVGLGLRLERWRRDTQRTIPTGAVPTGA